VLGRRGASGRLQVFPFMAQECAWVGEVFVL
jgi:hypothetical protein